MNPYILKRISLVATAALVASGAAMAQSAGSGGSGSNSSGTSGSSANGPIGTSGSPTQPNTPPNASGGKNASPGSPSVDYNSVDPTAAGQGEATATTHEKSRHGAKKAKRSKDAASSPSVIDDPNRAGGGSGNSNVR